MSIQSLQELYHHPPDDKDVINARIPFKDFENKHNKQIRKVYSTYRNYLARHDCDLAVAAEMAEELVMTIEWCQTKAEKFKLIHDMEVSEQSSQYDEFIANDEREIMQAKAGIEALVVKRAEIEQERQNRMEYEKKAMQINQKRTRQEAESEIENIEATIQNLETSHCRLLAEIEDRKNRFQFVLAQMHWLNDFVNGSISEHTSQPSSPITDKENGMEISKEKDSVRLAEKSAKKRERDEEEEGILDFAKKAKVEGSRSSSSRDRRTSSRDRRIGKEKGSDKDSEKEQEQNESDDDQEREAGEIVEGLYEKGKSSSSSRRRERDNRAERERDREKDGSSRSRRDGIRSSSRSETPTPRR